MDVVFLLFVVLIGLMVAMWTLSLLARGHVHIATSLTPDQVADLCEGKFSRLGWRRVEGRGNLNYQPRGFAFRGATPPVLSFDIGTDDDGRTLVEMWLSEWTTQYGMISHVEKVFWKRWTIPRAIHEAENGTRSLPTDPGHALQQQVVHTGTAADGERKAASTDPRVVLADPGRAETDQKQLAYGLFRACGLTILSWGPLPLEQHVQALVAAAPAFRRTEVSIGGTGSLPHIEGMWMGFDGPDGSLIAYFVTGGEQGQSVVDDVLNPILQMPASMSWGIGTRDGSVAAGAANIFASGRVVPLWELTPFATQRPAEQSGAEVPPALAAGLTRSGWAEIGDNVFRRDLPVAGENLQTVFFGAHDADSFAVMAPVGSSPDGVVPSVYRGRLFGRYQLRIVADMVMLCQDYPARPVHPAPGNVIADAQALAEYAFRQAEDASNASPTIGIAAPTESPRPLLVPPGDPVAGYVPPPAPSPSRSSRNPVVMVCVIAAVCVVAVGAIYTLTQSDDESANAASSGAGSGSKRSSASVDEVEECSSVPTLQAESVGYDNRGLTISTTISSSCSSGDLLSNRQFRVTAVDGSGRDVASGIFDLSRTPIVVGEDGTSVEFTFPAGTYWRTAGAINGSVRLAAYDDGYDTTPSGTMQSTSAVTADQMGQPENGNLEAVVQSALDDIAAADRAVIDATLLNRWEPQLSSKRVGLHADGITWSNPEILREHLVFRQQYPSARLLWSGDWPVYGDGTWWVTVSGVPFATGEQALGWCADRGYDWEHCFAKMLSHTMGSSGTTLLQKR